MNRSGSNSKRILIIIIIIIIFSDAPKTRVVQTNYPGIIKNSSTNDQMQWKLRKLSRYKTV